MKRLELSANAGWRFYRGQPPIDRLDNVTRAHVKSPFDADYDDSGWEVVTLPHSVRIERLMTSGGLNYQGEAWYRRRFTVTDEIAKMDLLFELEGAMQRADLWLDGAPLGFSEGGFLPAGFDLTGKVTADTTHILAIRVDNSDMPEIPPGKPQGSLDFNYFGGLYRDAWLKAAGKVRFSYAVHEGKPASGGIYVTYPVVSKEKAVIRVKSHILNHTETEADVIIKLSLECGADRQESLGGAFKVMPMSDAENVQEITVNNPKLWHPDHPHLYNLTVNLIDKNGNTLDEIMERIGVRSIRFTTNGFYINDEYLFLSGANRHQDYAYIGFALPDSIQRRDANALRKAGMVAIRTAHYPQDKAFMDACDELGMLCIIPTPGWQIHPQSVKFDFLSYENTRRLIRYNRNHPSAALWEPILNETDYPEYFAKKQLEIVMEETEDGLCACDSHYSYSEHYPVNYSFRNANPGKPVMIREYGDNYTEQFGPSATVRRVRRGANTGFYLGGEKYMIRSAQERFEDYYAMRATPGLNAAIMWAGIDHNRGYDPNEAAVGMWDLLRLPKFTYYIYAAQRDVSDSGPMVYIANFQTPDSPRDITVYTNCEAVRLSLNGRHIATLTVAEGWANTKIYAGAAYSYRFRNINVTRNIPDGVHPPLTFKGVAYEAGELTAEALICGRAVACHSVKTPGAAKKLRLAPHWEGVESWMADGSDLLMVHVFAEDDEGTQVPDEEREVKFSLDGDARIVGDGDGDGDVHDRIGANPVNLEAGATGVLLMAGDIPGKVTLRAETKGLASAEISLDLSANAKPLLEGPVQTPPPLRPEYAVDKSQLDKAQTASLFTMRTESWYRFNLAKGRPVTASSYAEGYPPENAAKGMIAEPWIASDTSVPQWWQCDFEARIWFYGATIYWQNDGLWYDYDILVSDDGEDWKTVSTGHASGQSYVPAYIAEPMLARFARVFVHSVSGGTEPVGINMVEFQGRPPENPA